MLSHKDIQVQLAQWVDTGQRPVMRDIQLTLEEEERQLVLLAIAHLAVNRPGWDYVLANIALKMDNKKGNGRPEMFDEFKALYRHSTPDHPTEEWLKRCLGVDGDMERAFAAYNEYVDSLHGCARLPFMRSMENPPDQNVQYLRKLTLAEFSQLPAMFTPFLLRK
jgi:hypothetical protein